jgi:hypothetical protein
MTRGPLVVARLADVTRTPDGWSHSGSVTHIGFIIADSRPDRESKIHFSWFVLRGCIQKFPDWVDNEIYAYNNRHSLRSNTKGCGGRTQKTDS